MYIDIRNESDTIKKYFKDKDLVRTDELISAIEELIWEVDRLNESIEDREQYYKDNYRKIDEHEYYGVSRKDFE